MCEQKCTANNDQGLRRQWLPEDIENTTIPLRCIHHQLRFVWWVRISVWEGIIAQKRTEMRRGWNQYITDIENHQSCNSENQTGCSDRMKQELERKSQTKNDDSHVEGKDNILDKNINSFTVTNRNTDIYHSIHSPFWQEEGIICSWYLHTCYSLKLYWIPYLFVLIMAVMVMLIRESLVHARKHHILSTFSIILSVPYITTQIPMSIWPLEIWAAYSHYVQSNLYIMNH